MDSGEWNDVFAKIQRKGVLIDGNVLEENFEDVVNKAFDRDMGFGYISDNGYKPKARVILQGKNPFINNHTDLLNPILGNHLPYSQVYHLGAGGQNGGRTYCILRHYLNIPGLSEEELDSIKIATCSLENMDSIDYMVERMEGENINAENYSVTVSEEVITQERKQSASFSENGNNVERKPMKKTSTQRLLEQMNQIVRPIADATGDGLASGQLLVTVHKARSVEKKGLVGKADPYVVLKYGTQTEKSATVNNNHDPIWHFTACFDIEEQSTNEITMEVFDDDFGKDDFLGKAIIDIHDIFESNDFVNKWIPLENCKTGEVLVSAKFIPLQRISRPVGHISLTLQKGKKIEKKNMMKKADPYVVIKLGKDQHKSETVKNTANPTWNYDFAFDIMEASPRQITFEVFDDDIGNDRPIGNVTLDTDTIMEKQKLDKLWTRLENCKSGEILISADFTPAPAMEDNEQINNTTTNIEMEVIDEQFEENKVQNISMAEKNLVNNRNGNHHHAVEFIDPVYCDDEYVIVEKNDNNWFMVVSSNPNLPINVNLVPFKQNSAENSPIYIYPIPRGGFHNIKRVVHSGRGLKKCGYEKPCILRAGQAYQFWTDTQGKNFNLGNLKTETWGPDTSWVVYKPEYFKAEDYIEASLKLADENEPEFSGSISLYDRLSVDAA
eukprot:GFUD01009876.1.p1 GENE.GFUD01009876.1~~GFUD01009876.1.p1  ORF type:complete len:669 (+),score=172.37 GFUD01009876.1:51-2057(+)